VPAFLNQRNRDWVRPLQDGLGKARSDIDYDQAIREESRRRGPWPKATLTDVCDHIDYMANRIGPRHVGIGSDFYGGPVPEGLEDVSRFPHLIAELMGRGWSDDALAGLAGGNMLRTMRIVECRGRQLRRAEPAPNGVGARP